VRDAAGFDDMPEQAEIGEIEAQCPFPRKMPSFEFDEGRLREFEIVLQYLSRYFVLGEVSRYPPAAPAQAPVQIAAGLQFR
jgi:hypothetical protein